MRANTRGNCGAPQADRHTYSASNTWYRLTLLLSDQPSFAEVDDRLCGDSISPLVGDNRPGGHLLGPIEDPLAATCLQTPTAKLYLLLHSSRTAPRSP